ncbi:MAG: hypothetical protein ABIT96_10770, partial [Ferruginibacter sp.]
FVQDWDLKIVRRKPLLIKKQMYKISCKSSAMFVKPKMMLKAHYLPHLHLAPRFGANMLLSLVCRVSVTHQKIKSTNASSLPMYNTSGFRMGFIFV